MNTDLTVPASASQYILLQRGAYQSWLLARLLRRAPGPFSLACARLEAAARRKQLAVRFARGIQRDFRSIESSLPETAASILDIGCGLAGLDVILWRRYAAARAPDLYLADYETTDTTIRYGFASSHSRHSSLRAAGELLTANGVPAGHLHFMEPEDVGRVEGLPHFDLVVSTLAWGFHFPVEMYADAVSRAIAGGGRLILDIRVGTNGRRELERWFRVDRVIEESESRQRVLAVPRGAA